MLTIDAKHSQPYYIFVYIFSVNETVDVESHTYTSKIKPEILTRFFSTKAFDKKSTHTYIHTNVHIRFQFSIFSSD